jgi:hypothetical protein
MLGAREEDCIQRVENIFFLTFAQMCSILASVSRSLIR